MDQIGFRNPKNEVFRESFNFGKFVNNQVIDFKAINRRGAAAFLNFSSVFAGLFFASWIAPINGVVSF
jgi:hypothetical protein